MMSFIEFLKAAHGEHQTNEPETVTELRRNLVERMLDCKIKTKGRQEGCEP